MPNIIKDYQKKIASGNSVAMLRLVILIWAILVVIFAFSVDDPLLLAVVILYEVLP